MDAKKGTVVMMNDEFEALRAEVQAVRESQERVERLVTDFYQKLAPMIERVEKDGPMSLLGGMFGRGR